MATLQEQYTELVQQSQEAVLAAVDSWTRTVQDTYQKFPAFPAKVNPNQVIDQVFDFAEKLLELQRDFAKNLVTASASVAETVAAQGARRTNGTASA
jgi:acetyl-CoA carboxylase carboxyltransferase component